MGYLEAAPDASEHGFEQAAALAVGDVDPLAHALVAGWLLGYRGHTRRAYLTDLRDFAAWCRRHGLALRTVGRAHVEAYARSLEEAGRARTTVARRLSTVAGLYRYLVEEGYLASSPLERIRRPHVGDDSPTLGLDRDELRAFLDASSRNVRDHALACLLALNGLRVSEACGTDVTDLDTVRGHRVLWVTRKHARRATTVLAARTVEAIRLHRGERDSGPLLLANDHGRLDRYDAARIVRRLGRAAGLGKRISPHSLRHSFVTAALDAGVSLRDVQDAAGHADPRTTRRYDRGRHSLDRHATYQVAAYLDRSTAG
jgi:integrase/recombinase XerD